MMTEQMGTQLEMYCYTIEDLVPEDNEFRKIAALIDFSFIYDEVRHLYSVNMGRPSIDPIVLVKYLLIGFLKGIASERQIEQEIRLNNAYRWFLGIGLFARVPDHSTISQLRRRKLNGTDLFRKIFERILWVCMENGLVDGKLVLTDSTHVKANASKKSEIKVQVEKQGLAYWKRLNEYEEAERRALEAEGKIAPAKKRRTSKEKPKIIQKTTSTTDPDAGLLNRPEVGPKLNHLWKLMRHCVSCLRYSIYRFFVRINFMHFKILHELSSPHVNFFFNVIYYFHYKNNSLTCCL